MGPPRGHAGVRARRSERPDEEPGEPGEADALVSDDDAKAALEVRPLSGTWWARALLALVYSALLVAATALAVLRSVRPPPPIDPLRCTGLLSRRRAANTSAPQPATPYDSASEPGSGAPLLLLTDSSNGGRYSNQREALLSSLAVARFTARDLGLALPSLGICGDQLPLAAFFDTAHVAASLGTKLTAGYGVDLQARAALHRRCSAGPRLALNIARRPWGKPGSEVSYLDATWRVVDAAALGAPLAPHGECDAAALADPALCNFTSPSSLFSAPVYRDFASPHMAGVIGTYTLDAPTLPHHLRDSGRKAAECVALPCPFYSFNYALLEGAYEQAVAALHPAPWITQLVDAWLARQGVPLSGQGVAALHLRLTDQRARGELGVGFADQCYSTTARPALLARMRAHFLSPASNPPTVLVVASDDLGSDCVRDAVGLFTDVTSVVLASGDSLFCTLLGTAGTAPAGVNVEDPRAFDCVEAQFIQEVLARSELFLGTTFSTFSTAVHGIRVLRHGRSVNSTLLL